MVAGFRSARTTVVDDSPAFRTAARALLRGGGVQVAVDGDDVLRRIAHHRRVLVLLAVALPGLDGDPRVRRWPRLTHARAR
jgi:CheY-like chemotaxis protein